MTEQPKHLIDRRSKIGEELNEKGMMYFNGKKMPVKLKDSRAGGIGIEISQRKLKRLKLQKEDRTEIELLMPTGKYEKIEFIVKHITPIDDSRTTKHQIGLQYADRSTLTNMQRNIKASNQI
jgi:hypothetical protein